MMVRHLLARPKAKDLQSHQNRNLQVNPVSQENPGFLMQALKVQEAQASHWR